MDKINKTFKVSNSNSTAPMHPFTWKISDDKLVILDADRKEAKWRPGHWMRLKENYEKN